MKRLVVKIGTGVLTAKNGMLDEAVIKGIVDQVSRLLGAGMEVIIVSSGAIGAGMGLTGLKKRPSGLSELQSLAAIGQTYLMDVYNKYFKKSGHLTGQILLTQDDFDDRKRYLNIKSTINELLKHRAVPVINENDTISTEEIKCGDNDRLSALVADLMRADGLAILSNVDGLIDKEGNVVACVEKMTENITRLARSERCEMGTGGMSSKLKSAEFAAKSGVRCFIANGKSSNALVDLVEGKGTFTCFNPAGSGTSARKRWIGFGSKARGVIKIDDGARSAILHKNKSLLPAGITGASGRFERGDIVSICGADGAEVARGISNYAAGELQNIKGLKTGGIAAVIGKRERYEAVHKDNLVVL